MRKDANKALVLEPITTGVKTSFRNGIRKGHILPEILIIVVNVNFISRGLAMPDLK